tara:strand:- start:236 stop:454 length:219 start_codon:yes stop_codon:yes gene_type:complete
MSKIKRIVLGEDDFNGEWLRSVTENHAVYGLGKALKNPNRVRKAWKIANGLSKPNYIDEVVVTKKATSKKKK